MSKNLFKDLTDEIKSNLISVQNFEKIVVDLKEDLVQKNDNLLNEENNIID